MSSYIARDTIMDPRDIVLHVSDCVSFKLGVDPVHFENKLLDAQEADAANGTDMVEIMKTHEKFDKVQPTVIPTVADFTKSMNTLSNTYQKLEIEDLQDTTEVREKLGSLSPNEQRDAFVSAVFAKDLYNYNLEPFLRGVGNGINENTFYNSFSFAPQFVAAVVKNYSVVMAEKNPMIADEDRARVIEEVRQNRIEAGITDARLEERMEIFAQFIQMDACIRLYCDSYEQIPDEALDSSDKLMTGEFELRTESNDDILSGSSEKRVEDLRNFLGEDLFQRIEDSIDPKNIEKGAVMHMATAEAVDRDGEKIRKNELYERAKLGITTMLAEENNIPESYVEVFLSNDAEADGVDPVESKHTETFTDKNGNGSPDIASKLQFDSPSQVLDWAKTAFDFSAKELLSKDTADAIEKVEGKKGRETYERNLDQFVGAIKEIYYKTGGSQSDIREAIVKANTYGNLIAKQIDQCIPSRDVKDVDRQNANTVLGKIEQLGKYTFYDDNEKRPLSFSVRGRDPWLSYSFMKYTYQMIGVSNDEYKTKYGVDKPGHGQMAVARVVSTLNFLSCFNVSSLSASYMKSFYDGAKDYIDRIEAANKERDTQKDSVTKEEKTPAIKIEKEDLIKGAVTILFEAKNGIETAESVDRLKEELGEERFRALSDCVDEIIQTNSPEAHEKAMSILEDKQDSKEDVTREHEKEEKPVKSKEEISHSYLEKGREELGKIADIIEHNVPSYIQETNGTKPRSNIDLRDTRQAFHLMMAVTYYYKGRGDENARFDYKRIGAPLEEGRNVSFLDVIKSVITFLNSDAMYTIVKMVFEDVQKDYNDKIDNSDYMKLIDSYSDKYIQGVETKNTDVETKGIENGTDNGTKEKMKLTEPVFSRDNPSLQIGEREITRDENGKITSTDEKIKIQSRNGSFDLTTKRELDSDGKLEKRVEIKTYENGRETEKAYKPGSDAKELESYSVKSIDRDGNTVVQVFNSAEKDEKGRFRDKGEGLRLITVTNQDGKEIDRKEYKDGKLEMETKQDGNGNVTKDHYDDIGNGKRDVIVSSVQDKEGNIISNIEKTYDRQTGRLSSEIDFTKGEKTDFAYDSKGKNIERTTSKGTEVVETWEKKGNIEITAKYKNGKINSIERTENNRTTERTEITTDGKTVHKFTNNIETTRDYLDNEGKLYKSEHIEQPDKDGNVKIVVREPDQNGMLVETGVLTVDKDEKLIDRTEYTENGESIETKYNKDGMELSVDRYDSEGNLLSHIDLEQEKSNDKIEQEGSKKTDSSSIEIVKDYPDHTEKKSYDSEGKLISYDIEYNNGNSIKGSIKYDEDGRGSGTETRIEVESDNETVKLSKIEYTYSDQDNNLLTRFNEDGKVYETEKQSASIDPETGDKHIQQEWRDENDDLIKKVDVTEDSDSKIVRITEYNSNGIAISDTFQGKETIERKDYDEQGRLKSLTETDPLTGEDLRHIDNIEYDEHEVGHGDEYGIDNSGNYDKIADVMVSYHDNMYTIQETSEKTYLETDFGIETNTVLERREERRDETDKGGMTHIVRNTINYDTGESSQTEMYVKISTNAEGQIERFVVFDENKEPVMENEIYYNESGEIIGRSNTEYNEETDHVTVERIKGGKQDIILERDIDNKTGNMIHERQPVADGEFTIERTFDAESGNPTLDKINGNNGEAIEKINIQENENLVGRIIDISSSDTGEKKYQLEYTSETETIVKKYDEFGNLNQGEIYEIKLSANGRLNATDIDDIERDGNRMEPIDRKPGGSDRIDNERSNVTIDDMVAAGFAQEDDIGNIREDVKHELKEYLTNSENQLSLDTIYVNTRDEFEAIDVNYSLSDFAKDVVETIASSENGLTNEEATEKLESTMETLKDIYVLEGMDISPTFEMDIMNTISDESRDIIENIGLDAETREAYGMPDVISTSDIELNTGIDTLNQDLFLNDTGIDSSSMDNLNIETSDSLDSMTDSNQLTMNETVGSENNPSNSENTNSESGREEYNPGNEEPITIVRLETETDQSVPDVLQEAIDDFRQDELPEIDTAKTDTELSIIDVSNKDSDTISSDITDKMNELIGDNLDQIFNTESINTGTDISVENLADQVSMNDMDNIDTSLDIDTHSDITSIDDDVAIRNAEAFATQDLGNNALDIDNLQQDTDNMTETGNEDNIERDISETTNDDFRDLDVNNFE